MFGIKLYRVGDLPASSIEWQTEGDLVGEHATLDVEIDGVEHVVLISRVGGATCHLDISRDQRGVVSGECPSGASSIQINWASYMPHIIFMSCNHSPVVPRFIFISPVAVVVVCHDIDEVKPLVQLGKVVG